MLHYCRYSPCQIEGCQFLLWGCFYNPRCKTYWSCRQRCRASSSNRCLILEPWYRYGQISDQIRSFRERLIKHRWKLCRRNWSWEQDLRLFQRPHFKRNCQEILGCHLNYLNGWNQQGALRSWNPLLHGRWNRPRFFFDKDPTSHWWLNSYLVHERNFLRWAGNSGRWWAILSRTPSLRDWTKWSPRFDASYVSICLWLRC